MSNFIKRNAFETTKWIWATPFFFIAFVPLFWCIYAAFQLTVSGKVNGATVMTGSFLLGLYCLMHGVWWVIARHAPPFKRIIKPVDVSAHQLPKINTYSPGMNVLRLVYSCNGMIWGSLFATIAFLWAFELSVFGRPIMELSIADIFASLWLLVSVIIGLYGISRDMIKQVTALNRGDPDDNA